MSPQDRIGLFQKRVGDLAQKRLIRSNALFAEAIFRFDAAIGMEALIKSPDEETLEAFLGLFRQFWLQGEPIHAHGIYNLCITAATSDGLKNRLISGRQAWKERHNQSGMSVQIKNGTVTPERAMDLMINGHYFHNDEAKLKELNELGEFGRMLTRMQFIHYVSEATKYIFFLRAMTVVGLRDGTLRLPKE